MKKSLLLISTIWLFGCTHSLHLVNFSDFRPYGAEARGKVINAKSEQFVILGFVGDTNYVEEAYHKLQRECPQGAITGISSRFYTSHGFFSWTNHLEMQGLCLNPS